MENNKIKVVDEFNYENFMKIDKTNYIDKKPRWRIVVTLERGDSYTFISNICNRECAILEVSKLLQRYIPKNKIKFIQSNNYKLNSSVYEN